MITTTSFWRGYFSGFFRLQAITGYQGLPGSGKSYQVVSHVVVGALRAGRRVVTNLDGLNYGAIQAHLVDNGVPIESIGTLVVVDNEAVKSPFFYYDPEDAENSIVKPGDVVVLDEAWEFFEDGTAIPERTMRFFRYHRHYTNPNTQIACDIVLISQDINDIGRKIKRVIEQTVTMTKLKELGTDKTFRIDIYHKTNSRKKPVYSEIGRYDPKFFQLYSSYSGKGGMADLGGVKGKERRVEKRGTLFSGSFFKYVMPLAFLALLISLYWGYSFFSNPNLSRDFGTSKSSPTSQDVESLRQKHLADLQAGKLPPLRNNPNPQLRPEFLEAQAKASQVTPETPAVPAIIDSARYSIAGVFGSPENPTVILSTLDGRKIFIRNSMLQGFVVEGTQVHGVWKGEFISGYTGVSGASSSNAKSPFSMPGSK
jgi:zona occludens toxin